jgi:hypothetical protein
MSVQAPREVPGGVRLYVTRLIRFRIDSRELPPAPAWRWPQRLQESRLPLQAHPERGLSVLSAAPPQAPATTGDPPNFREMGGQRGGGRPSPETGEARRKGLSSFSGSHPHWWRLCSDRSPLDTRFIVPSQR